MRRPSVADQLARGNGERERRLAPGERIEHALALGRRDLALYAAVSGLSLHDARRAVERRRQARRRPSAAVDRLLA